MAEAWDCGEFELEERHFATPGPPLARIALPDGAELTISSLEASYYTHAATWGDRQLEGRGDRSSLERAFLEWAIRGGPGGGNLALGDQTLALPVGCLVEGAVARCADGSSAAFRDGPPPGEPLGQVSCQLGVAEEPCRVDAIGTRLALSVPTQGKTLVCSPSETGEVDACGGLRWDPAGVAALLPDPATGTCHLEAERPVWTCTGARVLVRPWVTGLGLPPELPPTQVKGVWLMTGSGVFRGCEGPSTLCAEILADWSAAPPGLRELSLYGAPVAVPVGCDAAIQGDHGAIVCEDGIQVAWGVRLPSRPPQGAPAKPCKVLGLRATCTAVPGSTQALFDDVPGGVLCQTGWCQRLGIPEVPP